MQNMSEFQRGEIYYVSPSYAEVGSEIWSGRPAIIVSGNDRNRFSQAVEVVYLTTQPKDNSPVHVLINATGKPSTALCEQITTVDKIRLKDQNVRCTPKEMAQIDAALLSSLALDAPPVKTVLDLDKIRLLAERDIYKNLYENLLDRLGGPA